MNQGDTSGAFGRRACRFAVSIGCGVKMDA